MRVSIRASASKQELFREGLERCYKFLDVHGIKRPKHVFDNPIDANRYRENFIYKTWFGAHVVERNVGAIVVNVKKCRVATRVPGWSWTFPGYKADLTPYGVVCHEFGHHVDFATNKNGRTLSKSKTWKRIVDNEEDVSSYEPNYCEAFAEAFRLFMTNPGMLREGRPERWEYFTAQLGFAPIHSKSWKVVLKHAHPRIIAAAEKWIIDP